MAPRASTIYITLLKRVAVRDRQYIQYVVARGDPTLAIALMEERIKMVDEFCGCGGESGDGDCMLPLLDLVYQEHQKLLLATRTE